MKNAPETFSEGMARLLAAICTVAERQINEFGETSAKLFRGFWRMFIKPCKASHYAIVDFHWRWQRCDCEIPSPRYPEFFQNH